MNPEDMPWYNVKKCKDCGIEISDNYHNSMHSHNALMYCPECERERIRASKRRWARKHREEERWRRKKVRWADEEAKENEQELYGLKERQLSEMKKIVSGQKEYIRQLQEINAKLRAELNK